MRQVVKFVISFVILVLFLANTISIIDFYPSSSEDSTIEIDQYEGKPEEIKEEQPVDPKPPQDPPKSYDPETSPEGYIEKWYSQEPGFNESLIASVKRLTTGGIASSSASFSPDGTKIIYSSKEDGGDYLDIWMMDIDGTNNTQLTTEDFDQYQAHFLSDGIHIVYLASHGEPGMNFHVRNLKDNTTKSIALHGMHPNVTPDNRIMIVSILNSSPILIDVNLENITYLPGNANGQWPDMSTDGTKIVFMEYNCNHYNQLSLYDVKNDTLTQLTSESINHYGSTMWNQGSNTN
jgi:Tol biopolymer transport system component